MACEAMARGRWARLWCLSGPAAWMNILKPGTLIDGQVSEQLIRNIFFPNASLHDGAMVIRDGRVAAAGYILPSENHHLSADRAPATGLV